VLAGYLDRFIDIVGDGNVWAIHIGRIRDSSLFARRISTIKGCLVASPAYIAQHELPPREKSC